jgi:hypothetical protein
VGGDRDGAPRTWGALLLVGGPLIVRTDLRQDLAHLATLRALPMRGRDLVGAEVLASTLALTAAQLGLLVVTLLSSLGAREGLGTSLEARLAVGAAIAVALPGVNLASFVIHNGAALLFPAWVRPAGGAARGVEATGQGLVTTGLTLVGLAVLLAAPGGTGLRRARRAPSRARPVGVGARRGGAHARHGGGALAGARLAGRRVRAHRPERGGRGHLTRGARAATPPRRCRRAGPAILRRRRRAP